MIDDDFDDEYASPSQWARMYRKAGLQVVPAMHPEEARRGEGWKRPVVRWSEYEKEMISDELFTQWYGRGGKYAGRHNMGFVTGQCSGWAFMVDLDTHKNPFAGIWWQGIHDDHAGGLLSETPTQTTGGGGKQYLFIAPPGWIPPTIKTEKGIDIRGRGGFAMLPPSLHESGKNYQWDDGLGPWQIPIMVAPKWLCDEIDRLVLENGGALPLSITETSISVPSARIHEGTGTTVVVKNDFGLIVDGREAQMTKMIYGRMVDEYRKDPTLPTPGRFQAIALDLFKQYVSLVKPRLENPLKEKFELLEEEGRGLTLFKIKMHDTLRKWDTKIRRAAEVKPASSDFSFEKKQEETTPPEPDPDDAAALQDEFNLKPEHVATFLKDPSVFEALSIQQIYDLPDPQYLIKDLFIENGLFFVYGAPGCCKTFIVLDMALAIAAGLPSWWGKEIERSGPIIYISSEGKSDMKFRIKAWAETKGVAAQALPFRLVHESISFMSEDDVAKLCRTVDGVVKQMQGEMPVMIVVDTVSRVLPGADENLQKDMTMFVKACDRLRGLFGCCVLGVHHMNRSGGNMRGSTVLDGAADAALMITKDNTAMEGEVFASKIKSAQGGWTWSFGVDVTPLVSGNTSLTVRKLEDPMPMPEVDAAFGGAQETNKLHLGHKKWDQQLIFNILNALQDDFEAGRGWANAKNTPRYLGANMHGLFKIHVDDAKALIDDLYLKNLITEDVDAHSKMRSYKLGGNQLPGFLRKPYER